jgi:hypothetical protein
MSMRGDIGLWRKQETGVALFCGKNVVAATGVSGS